MNQRTRERASQLFGALSHPTRLRIVEALCFGEKTVNEIAALLQLGQSGTSQHLAILARAGALVVEPRGAMRVYRVRGPRLARILGLIEEFCAAHELYGLVEEEGEGKPEENSSLTESGAPQRATPHRESEEKRERTE